jgi:environmental stress-induced protein Ves
VQLLRAADRKTSPWKNGGGVTCEIATGPAGSAFSDFDWRVSTAVVAADGDFSYFANVDRTLLLIGGSGMALRIGGRTTTLTTASEPLRFAGDAPARAQLLDGPVTDLNVMVRRGRWTSAVRRQALPWTEAATGAGVRLLVTLGRARLLHGGGEVPLEPLDAVALAGDETLRLHPRDPEAAVVRIELAAAQRASAS